MDEHTISPAGDPFYAAARQHDQDRPCICYGGLVFIGHHELTEEGEEIEVVVSVPCRRCTDNAGVAY